jgi:heme exporter protein CcmD
MLADTANQAGHYWFYVGVGYGAAFVALGGYTVRTLLRGRRLSRKLPPDQRRWM